MPPEDNGGGACRQRRPGSPRHPEGGRQVQHALRTAQQVPPGGPHEERAEGNGKMLHFIFVLRKICPITANLRLGAGVAHGQGSAGI